MLQDEQRKPRTVLLLNGLDIERWLLKTLCGLVVSGTAEVIGIDNPQGWRPPLEWLNVIFGSQRLPDGCGLNFVGKPGDSPEMVPTFAFSCISNTESGVYGLAASFVEKPFILAMTRSREGILTGSIHRPAIIRSTNGFNEDLLVMRWAGLASMGMIEIHFNGPSEPD